MAVENISQREVSRRTIAKGAAWSAPLVTIAAAAPALAASAATPVRYARCFQPPTETVGTASGVRNWTAISGSQSADPTTWGGRSDSGNGTRFDVAMGYFSLTQPSFSGGTATGYTMAIGTSAIIRTASGVVGNATITDRGVSTAQVLGTGVQQTITIQSTVPYSATDKMASNYMRSVSIPFCVTYLDGLNPIPKSDGSGTECCYWVNYCYDGQPDSNGTYPNGATAVSQTITLTPEDPCATGTPVVLRPDLATIVEVPIAGDFSGSTSATVTGIMSRRFHIENRGSAPSAPVTASVQFDRQSEVRVGTTDFQISGLTTTGVLSQTPSILQGQAIPTSPAVTGVTLGGTRNDTATFTVPALQPGQIIQYWIRMIGVDGGLFSSINNGLSQVTAKVAMSPAPTSTPPAGYTYGAETNKHGSWDTTMNSAINITGSYSATSV